MNLTSLRRSGSGDSVQCDRCKVHYRPSMTRWACPVCDTDAPGARSAAGELAWQDADVRVVAIVITATIINLLLLAALTIVAFK